MPYPLLSLSPPAPRPPGQGLLRALALATALAAAAGALVLGRPARAAVALDEQASPPIDAGFSAELQSLAEANAKAAHPRGAASAGAPRVQVEVGRLDTRLRLAPCNKVTPFLAPGTRLWGAARIGLRCTEGAVRWQVYLPIAVKVFGTAQVAVRSLPAGHTLAPGDLHEAEFDWAQARGAVFAAAPLGRVLSRALAAEQGLRDSDLAPLQWFAAGDTVRIVYKGADFAVAGSGEALSAGLDGRSVKARTAGGRIVSGLPRPMRVLEIEP